MKQVLKDLLSGNVSLRKLIYIGFLLIWSSMLFAYASFIKTSVFPTEAVVTACVFIPYTIFICVSLWNAASRKNRKLLRMLIVPVVFMTWLVFMATVMIFTSAG